MGTETPSKIQFIMTNHFLEVIKLARAQTVKAAAMPIPDHIRYSGNINAQISNTARGRKNCEVPNNTALTLRAPQVTALVNFESIRNWTVPEAAPINNPINAHHIPYL